MHLLADTGSPPVPVAWRDDHGFSFSVTLTPGLYTVGLQADLAEFDWESLYLPMTWFGNSGQRTGPWDFDLFHENTPLLPTWRIHLNGEYLGLFYIQRPTVEDVARKTLRGEFGFRVRAAGEVTVRAEPYRPFSLAPLAVYLEPSAFDRYTDQPCAERGVAANWAAATGTSSAWASLRDDIAGTEWERYLRAVRNTHLERLAGSPDGEIEWPALPADAVPPLVMAGRVFGDDVALAAASDIIKGFLDRPHWGNTNPEGYGYNGDMAAARTLKGLSLAYNWLGAGHDGLREALLERLALQMERFLDQQLLHQQYWGGAVTQDHGYCATASAATAALALLGHCEQAPEWLAFFIPRMRRILDKAPRDGFIPFAQYHKIELYVNSMADFRTAFLYASGEDVFADSGYLRVPAYIQSCLDEPSMSTHTCTTRGDRKDFVAGLPFFLCLARDYGCDRSAYLARLLWRHYRRFDYRLGKARQHVETAATAVLAGRGFEIDKSTPRPGVPALNWFADGGAINYRDDAARFQVAVTCLANGSSFHALGTDLTGTDCGLPNPSCGNFSVAVAGRPLLQSAESGYRTGTALANVLLIDGRGQYGDNGDPMGVPMTAWRGQRIQTCRADAAGGGFARLNLAPAYPDDLAVLTYTRDFHFSPGAVRVRDTVVTRDEHVFSYHFPTYARHDVDLFGRARCRIGDGESALAFAVEGDGWAMAVGDTEVVWAYTNEQNDQPFRHVEIRHAEPCHAFMVDFAIRLEP